MEKVITSVQNAQVKAAVKLRDRRGRTQQGRTIIDGLREIRRAIETGFPVETVYLCPARLAGAEVEAFSRLISRSSQVSSVEVTPEVMEKLAFGERMEGAVAVAQLPSRNLADIHLPKSPLVVVLEKVEKPGNLGAVLRTMDAVGADLLISVDGRTDVFNPNAIRASMGTIFSVPIVEATTTDTLAFLREQGMAMLAARVDGSVPYTTVDLKKPTAIVLGSEAHGLTEDWQQKDVTNIHLPMRGIADSLNVSITAAVLLYEALRQRQ